MEHQIVIGFAYLRETQAGVRERNVLDPLGAFFPFLGDGLVAVHHAENARRRCRIAVGIVAAAGGDVHGPFEIALPVEQADDHERAVDGRIDVEAIPHALGAADVVGVTVGHFEPALFPVVRILFPVFEHVGDGGVELGTFRNQLQRLRHDGRNVVADIGQGVHGADIDAAVPAVAIVHDVTDAVAELRDAVDVAGIEHADKVGLDLEIDVIRVGIVLPVAALGRSAAVEDIVTGRLVGVPEFVVGMGEGFGVCLLGGVDALPEHDFQESEVHVNVVVQTGILHIGIIDVVVVPGDGNLVHDQAALVLELGRTAVGAADRLAVPAALDLVHQGVRIECDGASRQGFGCRRTGRKKKQRKKDAFHHGSVSCDNRCRYSGFRCNTGSR